MMWVEKALDIGKDLLDRIPNPAERERAEADMRSKLLLAMVEEGKSQAEINKQEAAHSSIFVAGWRPFIGWTGGISLAYKFIVHPFLSWFLLLAGVTTPLPAPDTEALMALVTAMLGVAAARSFDKWKGTSR